ncbi:GDSL-type esterase/lipase family protein [Corynebacterium marinum]|uniref:Secreted hydrolase n=1 Tax=Corynebacterium marinum DSM 44953 TaxID=1224162 RepID=A0A0B6TJ02_9CORY|nr:GDSL-type esterase/lipase family protein [Corynebacterium marinum]AJK67888.1 secreted hydrolase [Corynebacterium marinum DSM 44953]GGO11789.1 putative secreted hydrolase [Corynebacterium marinum]
MPTSSLRSSSRLCVAFVLALLLLVGVIFAPASQARTRNLVVFGDSVVADPPVGEYLARKVERGSSNSTDGRFCPTSQSNFGVRAATKLGLQAADYSCSGATATGTRSFFGGGQTIGVQVDRALADGALTPATARVVVSNGFNDTYSNAGLPGEEVRARFVASMAPQIGRIRAAAPNARIQVVGYATIADGGYVCLFNAGGDLRDRTYAPQVGQWEQLAQDMQRDLAAAAGVEFLDLKPSTADRGMCAPDHLRNWAGIVDVNASPQNLPFHMNARGHEHVAEVVARS